MTRPNVLVLDGNEVKVRLQAERLASKTPVHVDWVRFTTSLRKAPAPAVDDLFPLPEANIWDQSTREARFRQLLAELPDCDYAASQQALDMARAVCVILGESFAVASEVRKGHDFYKFRWSIERNGREVGWVGYLASSTSKRQAAQSSTIHCNLYGEACTFAVPGWNSALADLIDQHEGELTRGDLALDLFDGAPWGDMKELEGVYHSGGFDVRGKRPESDQQGKWMQGHSRSLYIGSRGAGKVTNIYEKGDQLYGHEANSPWVRVELRYGNKLRVLPSDMLRRPADFFAGASDWHAATLAQAAEMVTPEPVKCVPRLPAETVEAEVTRNLRWTLQTAAPSLAVALKYMGDEFNSFLDLFEHVKLPGRLERFKGQEIREAFAGACRRVITVEGVRPAFA